MAERLGRTGPAAPVRIVHLGLGNFFRAHQAWYTAHAPEPWGIAAFTGRSATQAETLRPQDGCYTLVTRGPAADDFEVIDSISAVHAASEHDAFLDYCRSPALAVVTSTVTEAAFLLSDPRVQDDVAALQDDLTAAVSTVPARLLAGLIARHRAEVARRLAIVPCDNLPDNGTVVADVLRDLAGLVDPALVPLIDETATFVTTMVDRITPRTTPADQDAVLTATGVADAAPVVTEPFSEWILSGDFPAGRPSWEKAGALLVDDVGPFEQRKLWLLNGGHSLLAYAASNRGHRTVADAMADPVCRTWLEQLWDEAARHLPSTGVPAYRKALRERFENPRMQHQLAQIAADGSQKLPIRVLPVIRLERAAGRLPEGGARVLAGWIGHLRGGGAPVTDPYADQAIAAASGPVADAVPRVLSLLDPALPDDTELCAAVLDLVG